MHLATYQMQFCSGWNLSNQLIEDLVLIRTKS
jgi:hypothetical protein